MSATSRLQTNSADAGKSAWREDVGLGFHILSSTAAWASRHYHSIIAFATTLIILALLPLYGHWPIVALALVIYAIYFVILQRIRKTKPAWLRSVVLQGFRTQLGLIAITALIYQTQSEHSALFILYFLVILIAIRNTPRPAYILVAIEAGALIIGVRLLQLLVSNPTDFDVLGWMQTQADAGLQIVSLGVLTFIVHHMTRTVVALRETVDGFGAINKLAAHIGTRSTDTAQQTFPFLETILCHMPVAQATIWMYDRNAKRAYVEAKLRLVDREKNVIEFHTGQGLPSIDIDNDDQSALAEAIRTREPQFCHTERHSLDFILLEMFVIGRDRNSNHIPAEMAYPIVIGDNSLSVVHLEFIPRHFLAELKDDYVDFLRRIEGLIKPMLVYASQLDRAETLQDAIEMIHGSMDIDAIMEHSLSLVVNKLGFELGSVSLVDWTHNEIRCVRGKHVELDWVEAARHSLDSDDIQAHVVRTGKLEVISGDDPRLDRHIYDRFRHSDLVRVFMPLAVFDPRIGQKVVIGTLEAGHNRNNQPHIYAEQLEMLQKVAEQLAIAISHSQLMKQVQETAAAAACRADALTLLHQIGEDIAKLDNANLDRLLAHLVNSAKQLLGADLVMVYRYDCDKTWMQLPVIAGDGVRPEALRLNLTHENLLSKLAEQTEPFYYSPSITKRASAPQKPSTAYWDLAQYVSDATAHRSRRRSFLTRHGIVSFAALPLMVDGERIGVMVVNFKRICDFGATERLIHELFAQKAAMAIWSAQSREREQANLIRKERNAFSREMHDSVKQSLATIRLMAYDLQQEVCSSDSELKQSLSQIEDIAVAASNETAFMISELRAPDHELQHLICGLHAYVERVQRWYRRFQITYHHVGLEQLPEDVATKSLRFAREAINNAVRHSQGTQISVCSEITDTELRLLVRDNGVGFDLCNVSPERIGLRAMREIALEMGGYSWFSEVPCGGTCACLNVPLNHLAPGYSARPIPDWLHQEFTNGGVNPWTLI